jgi:hypothetical protein
MNDIDFGAEASILSTHDLRALSRKVQLAIERRKFIDGVATGVAVMLAAAGVAAGAHVALSKMEAATSCPVCACAEASLSTSTSLADASLALDSAQSTSPSTSTLATVDSDAIAARASSAAAAAVGAANDARLATSSRAAGHAPEKSAELGLDEEGFTAASVAPVSRTSIGADGEEAPQSRLRAELALYDAAGRALSHGDFDAAASAAQTLRARYPDGPIAVEAGIVEVTALRDGGHRDDARSLLAILRADSRAVAKSSTLDALASSLGGNTKPAQQRLAAPPTDDDSDDGNRILERHRADDREEP